MMQYVLVALIITLTQFACDTKYQDIESQLEDISPEKVCEALNANDIERAKDYVKKIKAKDPKALAKADAEKDHIFYCALKVGAFDFALWFTAELPDIYLGADKNYLENDNALIYLLKNAKNNDKFISIVLAILRDTEDTRMVVDKNQQRYSALSLAVWLNSLDIVKAIVKLDSSTPHSKALVPEETIELFPVVLAKKLGYTEIWEFLGGDKGQAIAEFSDAIEEANVENILNLLIKADASIQDDLIESAYINAIENNRVDLLDRILKEKNLKNPNLVSFDASKIVRFTEKRRLEGNFIILLPSQRHFYNDTLNYLVTDPALRAKEMFPLRKLTQVSMLPYCLVNAANDPSAYKDQTLRLIRSKKINFGVKDIIFALQQIDDKDIVLSLLKRSKKLSKLQIETKTNIILHAFENKARSVEVIKKLLSLDKSILNVSYQRYLFGQPLPRESLFDRLIVLYNKATTKSYEEKKYDLEYIQFLWEEIEYLKSLPPDQVLRTRPLPEKFSPPTN